MSQHILLRQILCCCLCCSSLPFSWKWILCRMFQISWFIAQSQEPSSWDSCLPNTQEDEARYFANQASINFTIKFLDNIYGDGSEFNFWIDFDFFLFRASEIMGKKDFPIISEALRSSRMSQWEQGWIPRISCIAGFRRTKEAILFV